MIKFKFKNKSYLLDTDRLLFNVTMFILLVIFVVGACYVSKQDYATQVLKQL